MRAHVSPRRPPIETLFDDADLHAIAKPAGLATVSERWNPAAPTVLGELWKRWQRGDPKAPRPHVIHRLDKDTTGVLLFARNRDAQVEVRRQFRERTVRKSYLALALGCPSPEQGAVEIEVVPDPHHPSRMKTVRRGGKACVTEYEVIEVFRDLSLVRLHPLTGRTHQIRVSLQFIGHPCAVDPLYGGREELRVSEWKRDYRSGRGRAERPIIDRVTLHAERIEIVHPTSGEPLVIESSLPADLTATLRQLRRWWR